MLPSTNPLTKSMATENDTATSPVANTPTSQVAIGKSKQQGGLQGGQTSKLKSLFTKRQSTARDMRKGESIHRAARFGDAKAVASLIAQSPSSLHYTTKSGRTVRLYARTSTCKLTLRVLL
jgi:hypothetical protein